MWPFIKQSQNTPKPPTFVFKDGESFFKIQCKYGQTDIVKERAVVAIVLDAKSLFGAEMPVKLEADGSQMAVLRVASPDGGFLVPASTASNRGDPLMPGEVVHWLPMHFDQNVGNALGDARAGWVGLIIRKVAPEMDTVGSGWKVLSSYI